MINLGVCYGNDFVATPKRPYTQIEVFIASKEIDRIQEANGLQDFGSYKHCAAVRMVDRTSSPERSPPAKHNEDAGTEMEVKHWVPAIDSTRVPLSVWWVKVVDRRS